MAAEVVASAAADAVAWAAADAAVRAAADLAARVVQAARVVMGVVQVARVVKVVGMGMEAELAAEREMGVAGGAEALGVEARAATEAVGRGAAAWEARITVASPVMAGVYASEADACASVADAYASVVGASASLSAACASGAAAYALVADACTFWAEDDVC